MKQAPIRSYEQWQASLQNYTWVGDNVPGASDIDMMLHASNGSSPDAWLVFEFKSVGQKLPRGQRILLEGLRRLGMTVVVVYGPDSNDEYVLSFDWSGLVSKDELARMVESWWETHKLPRKKRVA